MARRILIIILVVVILAIVGGGMLYYSIIGESDVDVEEELEEGGSLFPFLDILRGRSDDDEINTLEGNDVQTRENISVPVLRQLWNDPVAGMAFGNDENGSTTIRFIERATGHVYESRPETTKTDRLTNTTLPRIQEVIWPTPDRILIRYLQNGGDDIETFSAHIVLPQTQSTSTDEVLGELRGQFLPLNITDMATNGDEIFYLLRSGTGVRGIVSALDGSGASEVFTSSIRDWIPQWDNESQITLTTKASSDINGHMFFLNTTNGSLTSIIQNSKGLTTRIDGNVVLYSEHQGQVPRLFWYRQTDEKIKEAPISTLAEKCTFDPTDENIIFCAVPTNLSTGNLPDSWYQGVTHFNDEIWRINIETRQTELLVNSDNNIDTIDLIVDKNAENLLFRNKTDNTLWLYRLSG